MSIAGGVRGGYFAGPPGEWTAFAMPAVRSDNRIRGSRSRQSDFILVSDVEMDCSNSIDSIGNLIQDSRAPAAVDFSS